MSTYDTLLAWLTDPRFFAKVRHQEESVRWPFGTYTGVRYPLRLNNGETVSLQYSNTHYCRGSNTEPKSFELWKCPPSPLIESYGGVDDPYAYVPTQVIVEYLDSLGGIEPLNIQLVIHALEGS